MSKVQVKYDISTFKGIPLHEIGPSFKFLVNNDEFQTSRIIAQILCPKIRDQNSENCDLNEFRINTGGEDGDFLKFFELLNAGSIEFLEAEIPFASLVLKQLENDMIKIEVPEVQITESNIFDLIKQHDKHQIIYSKQLQDDIDFIATHFILTKDKTTELLDLNLETLAKILSNENLILESEDQLLSFINQLYRTNNKYSVLYQYVNYVKISTDKMKEFIENFDFQHLQKPIWDSLSYRLQQPLNQENLNNNENQNQQHLYGITQIIKPNEENNGIIHYIQSKGKVNLVHLTSSCTNPPYALDNIIKYDPSKDICFHSTDLASTWICFDFNTFRVMITNYTIETAKWADYHPRFFIVQGSNDISKECNWIIIDEVNDTDALNGELISHTFETSNKCNKPFRFIRIQQTGSTKNGRNYFIFKSIEFFGTLIELE